MKKKFSGKRLLDIGFDIGLLLKGLFALGEILCGVALVFLTPDKLNQMISWITAGKLAEEPNDWLMNHIVLLGQSFTVGSQHFAIFYLVSHGIIKLTVIILLWKKQLWAYPLSVLVFIGFIVYQMIHFASSHSIMLLLLTVLDMIMIVLTILEYRKIKAERHNGSSL